MPTQLDIRQSVLRSALNMAGTAANATVDTILPVFDAELGKLFEDRNILLTDGGTVTFTGTQVQFTEAVNLVLNQKISGAVPQIISLGSSSQNFVNSGDMWIAVINRTAGTAVTSIVTAGNPLPAVSNANQEVFLIAKRIDAADGTQRLYFRNGSAFNAGQTARLGSAGSGSGSGGAGDDLDSLQFAADFYDQFTENAANANSSISTAFGTNATFNAAKSMYVLSYDASKTVTVTGTAVTMSAAPAYTVAVGDVLIVGSVAKKITVVTSQTAYTIESAFAANIVAGTACCVSQAVYTKDINNFAVDGSALSSAFPAAFSEIMVDYKDNAITNSNVFTPGAPVIAWTGSPDNTNFSAVSSRSTSELVSQTSVILPSAGTSLYLRFFAKQTSGSGTVNLINYKAYWQKSVTAAGTTNVLWSTFAMTNNSTTPVNCSVSVVGGKTTITVTNNSYPVGLLTGQTIGALEVLLNGASVDRFVSGSTPTTDAYYTEVSTNVIQLDRDYSSQALSISLIYSLQVIDNSSVNTSSISAIQGVMGDGFQAYVSQAPLMVSTVNTGTPSAGSFYSAIPNRASIVDFTQDLKPRMGIERIAVQNLFEIQNEFGPNGEPIFGVPGDTFNQIRLVGAGWTAQNGSAGVLVYTANANDYLEVTFYGTGLNYLTQVVNDARQQVASTDGGTEGGNLMPGATASAVIASRNTPPYNVIPAVSGLALGVHTVKIRNTTTTGSFVLYGIEILNSSASNVVTTPGISYTGGQKLVSTSSSALAYNATVTGTKGGRVLQYQNAAGMVGQAFQAVNGTIAYFNSSDHTNEEVSRSYWPSEFGAGLTDDWSQQATSTTNVSTRSFTLDDGTTTLMANSSIVGAFGGRYGIYFGSNNIIDFQFVGTGLDLEFFIGSAEASVYTFTIDGVAAGTLPYVVPSTGTQLRTYKIASGLPYGTHTVKIVPTSGSPSQILLTKFITYQPKKPALPSGSVELADFNVLATFAANTTAGMEFLSTGTLRKAAIREMNYIGTWTISQTVAAGTTGAVAGYRALGASAGAQVKYTFFGTGFDMRISTPVSAQTYTIAIDGTNPTAAGATATGAYGNWTSFVGSTGVATSNGTGSFGNGLWVSGLPLGLHTVTLTAASATSFGFESIDIITPIHSIKTNAIADQQNTLSIGSQGISDNRKITPVKDVLPATKAWAQAVGISSSPSTTSTTLVPCPDMSVTVKTSGGALDIFGFVAAAATSGAGNGWQCAIFIDGVQVSSNTDIVTAGGQYNGVWSNRIMVPVAAGVHQVEIYWAAYSATLQGFLTSRNLLVREN